MEEHVSVIMPARDAAGWIAAAIRSVQAQTHARWELLVADDASSDDTAGIVEALAAADPRITLVRLVRGVGAAEARNRLLARARGPYLAFLDSDDRWLPAKLERQLTAMRRRGSAFSYTAAVREYAARGNRTRLLDVPESVDYRAAVTRCPIVCSSVVLDARRVGRPWFDTEMGCNDDQALWLRLIRAHGPAHGLREPLVVNRKRPGSVSSSALRTNHDVWRTYRRREGMGVAEAAFHVAAFALYRLAKRAMPYGPPLAEPANADIERKESRC